MLEYLFFNPVFADKFCRELDARSVSHERQTEPVQNALLITTSEEIEETLWDELDDIYDNLAEQDQQLLQTRLDDDSGVNTAGIYIELSDQRQTIAQVSPEVMNRMLETISMDEFNQFVEAIVAAVETPDDTPFCKRD